MTLSEYKEGMDVIHSEEDSMFHKLKVSVQEFLNRHTGMTFTKTVKVGSFVAFVGFENVRIVRANIENFELPSETTTDVRWKLYRKELLKSMEASELHELVIPLHMLSIYYLAAMPLGKAVKDVVKQTQWLLNELNIEYYKKNNDNDDLLVKPEESGGKSVLVDVEKIAGLDSVESKAKLEKLNSILLKIHEIEMNVIEGELVKSEVDDSIIKKTSSEDDKVFVTKEQLEASENKNSERRKIESDELWL